MRRTTPLLLALLLATAVPAGAQQREVESVLVGARVRLMAPELTRAWIGGRVVFADSSVVIIDPTTRRWGVPLALNQASITRVQLSRGRIGSQRRMGAVLGGLAGTVLGVYSAWLVKKEEGTTDGWILVPMFAVGGVGAGAAIGSAIPYEGWDPVELPVNVVYEPANRRERES